MSLLDIFHYLTGTGLAFAILFFFLFLRSPAYSAEEIDCLLCHEPLSKEKVLHPALQMGCATCHTAIDASEIPHKKTNKITKGLFSEPPELCYECHDKSIFNKKTIHPALYMGCTSCHNPHSTEIPKLLLSEPPDLCFTCHDKAEFEGKTVHPPVVAGMCTTCHSPHSTNTEKLLLSEPPDLCFNCHDNDEFSKKNVHMPVADGMCSHCHNPHASENIVMLNKKPINVCLECHADIKKQPHVISGFSSAGHPIGEPKKVKKKIWEADDPAREGRKFYCGSCHNPHSSDSIRLFRYKASSTFGLCNYCHKK